MGLVFSVCIKLPYIMTSSLIILACVLLGTHQCVSVRLMERTGSKYASKGKESLSLSSVEFGDCAMRKITAFGSDEEEYVANFDAQSQKAVPTCELESQDGSKDAYASNFGKDQHSGKL